MATNFPNAKDSFPTMKDVTAADAILLAQYQSAMQAGEIAKAKQLLAQMTDGANKVIAAEYLNNIRHMWSATLSLSIKLLATSGLIRVVTHDEI